MFRGILSAAAGATLLAGTPAQAVVLATFTTHVSGLTNYQGAYGDLSVGDRVTLTYRYDPAINPDELHIDTSEYFHFGQDSDSPVTVTGSINGHPGTVNPSDQGQIDLFNDIIFDDFADGSADIWSANVRQVDQANGVETTRSWIGAAVADEIPDVLNPLRNFTYFASPDTFGFSRLEFIKRDVATGQTIEQQTVSLSLERLDVVLVNVVSPVPEPATWAMMIFGFGAAGAAARRSRIAGKVQKA